MPEIPGIHISQFFRYGRDGQIRIRQQTGGPAHFQLLDILAETHPGAVFDDPLDLPLAVVEKIRQILQGDRRIIFLHIFQKKYYIFIMPLGIRLRYDHVGAVVAEQNDEKRAHNIIQETLFILVISQKFPVSIKYKIKDLRIAACTEEQVRVCFRMIQGVREKIREYVVIRKHAEKYFFKRTGS